MQFNQLVYQDPATQVYLGSPSLVRLPDGALLASHDYFGPHSPHDMQGREFLSSIYRSDDDGATWRRLTHIAGAFWNNLFVHRGAVYVLGPSAHYGSIVIRRSDDGGYTWSRPLDPSCGLLFPGGDGVTPPNYHCAPMPVLEHQGRLYRAFEDNVTAEWGSGFSACVISAPVDADLLDAANWRMSNKLPFDPAWAPSAMSRPGWLEGNVVADLSGQLWDVLRFNSDPDVDLGARIAIHDEGRRITFDPQTGFFPMPGGMTKFSIRRDPRSGRYLALVNNNTEPSCSHQRNVLSLAQSDDLWHWSLVTTLIEDDSDLSPADSLRLVGFQYVDWQFDGDDIRYLVRTAYDGAHNYHDANRITYHRLRDYAALL